MRNLLFMFLILVLPSQLWLFEEPHESLRQLDVFPFERRHTMDQAQEPEPALEKGKIEDLKGITTIYVDAPDEFSSLFLREIVETVRKKIPRLIFVRTKDVADVWLLFSVESNVRDANVQGRIIRSLEPGHLRLVERYAGSANKGAEGFAKEFVKYYLEANRDPQSDVAQPQKAKSLPPSLTGESTSVAVTQGPTSARKASNSDEVSEGDILRTDTSLVTILTKIMRRDGKAASDMHEADFSVYENDVKQDIAFFEPVDRPFSVVLLIDSSTSVEAEFSEIIKATKVLVDRLRPDDQLVVATFNVKMKEVRKLAKIRNLRGESIQILRYAGPRIYDAMDFAASHYLRRWPGRKAVVVLTDGVDFGSFRTTAEGSLHDAEEYDALFYTIQYKTSEFQPRPVEKAQQQNEGGTAYLRELAEKTGGHYQRAEEMDHLSAAFDSVVKELSAQYSLGYYPSRPPQPGERRRIRVQVNQPDLVVHTRSSYVFKSPETKPAVPK
jgi:VWFA-related protein